MTMQRQKQREQLARFLKTHSQQPFAWGRFDCCLFAADCVALQTGIDYASEFRGHYQTRIGAARALKKVGFTSIEQAISAKLGQPINAKLCQRGDVVLLERPDGTQAAGVLFGGAVFATGEHGLERLPLSQAKNGWPIN